MTTENDDKTYSLEPDEPEILNASLDEAQSLEITDEKAASETAPATPEEELQRLKLELDQYKDLFLRKAAEFENYKRRRQQDYSALANSVTEATVVELLPVIDDFERLFHNAQEEEWNQEGFLRGAQLIYDKLMNALVARGLKPIEAVGQPFDPLLHEALLQQESSVEAGTVLQEYQKGYRLGDKVIRHSQVVVSA